MAAFTDYFENRLWDFIFRGQALGIAGSTAGAGSGPANLYVGLLTSAPTDATAGTEVAGGGYARVVIASTLANWSGTQGAGTTTASTGNTGGGSNNSSIVFPAPSAAWGTVVAMGVYDSASGGNLLVYCPLTTAKTINGSDPAPSFSAASLSVQIDN